MSRDQYSVFPKAHASKHAVATRTGYVASPCIAPALESCFLHHFLIEIPNFQVFFCPYWRNGREKAKKIIICNTTLIFPQTFDSHVFFFNFFGLILNKEFLEFLNNFSSFPLHILICMKDCLSHTGPFFYSSLTLMIAYFNHIFCEVPKVNFWVVFCFPSSFGF